MWCSFLLYIFVCVIAWWSDLLLMVRTWPFSCSVIIHYVSERILLGNSTAKKKLWIAPKYNCNQTAHCSCCIVTDSMDEYITVCLLSVCTLAAFGSPEAKIHQCLPHWKILLSVIACAAIHHLNLGKQLFAFVFL